MYEGSPFYPVLLYEVYRKGVLVWVMYVSVGVNHVIHVGDRVSVCVRLPLCARCIPARSVHVTRGVHLRG